MRFCNRFVKKMSTQLFVRWLIDKDRIAKQNISISVTEDSARITAWHILELVQIHAFRFKQVLIDVTEKFPHFVADILAQKIAYRHMRRCFFPVK